MEFFIASFDIFFVACYCKIEQFSVLKPSYLSFLRAVSTQLAFNERLQEIQKKKEPIVLQSCCKKTTKQTKKGEQSLENTNLEKLRTHPYPAFSWKVS